MNIPWMINEDDQCAVQGHKDLAVRRLWWAWLQAITRIQNLEHHAKRIQKEAEASVEIRYTEYGGVARHDEIGFKFE